VAFSPDGTMMITGSEDEAARVRKTTSGKVLRKLHNQVSSVAFSPDGTKVLTGSRDSTVLVWKVVKWIKWVILEGHTGGVKCIAFSPDSRHIITCDVHGRVFFWQGQGPELGRLLGIYDATYEVGAIYWQDAAHVVLADKGGPSGRPHFYRLSLEGEW
jgi:WD40 repeat protein